MPSAGTPPNEAGRLAALRSYGVLDTVCEAAFDNIAELAALLTGSTMSAVSLVDDDRQWLKAYVGPQTREIPRAQSFCAHAILTPGEPLIVPDALDDPRFVDNPLVTGEFGLRFYAGVPLIGHEQAPLGALCVLDREPRTLSAQQAVILRRLADAVMTTLELRRVTAELHRAAVIDFLTGLANRVALTQAIARALAQDGACDFGLLLLDLDGFKAVNDTLGHAAGDAVLQAVGAALRQSVRRDDLAARLGGDEFAVLTAGGVPAASAIAARFRAALADRMLQGGWSVTASIGLVAFAEAPASVEAVLRQADAAMYRAKAAGGDRLVVADAEPV